MMELKYLYDKILIKDKTITLLDRFVLDFTKLIKPYKHVIVSGYVAIFFGRARGTEDIDVLVEHMGKSQFSSFYSLVLKHDYYFLNPENEAGLYEMLCDGLGIRIAKKDTIIPNIEMKFTKDDFDEFSLSYRVEIDFDNEKLFFAPIEIQIPYKLYLGSDKDIEDAIFLWDIFNEKLDKTLLKRFMNELKVNGDIYGIIV